MHHSAKADHYNKESAHYDEFNEQNSKPVNRFIENILKKYQVKTVADFTCGTGSQVFYLAKQGFSIVGSDINAICFVHTQVQMQHSSKKILLRAQ